MSLNVEICRHWAQIGICSSLMIPTEQLSWCFLSSFSACSTLIIDTSVEKAKLRVVEKYDFEYRDVSKLIALFAVFASPSLRRKKEDRLLFFRLTLLKKSFLLKVWCKKASWWFWNILILETQVCNCYFLFWHFRSVRIRTQRITLMIFFWKFVLK